MINFTFAFVLVSLATVVAMVAFIELGRWMAARRRAKAGDSPEDRAGAIEGAVFALFGLLLAFSFSGAAARFEHRRELILAEANAIGTAYLRLDLLPEDAQPGLRVLFRQYLESRIATYRKLPDVEAARAEFERSLTLQRAIWDQAVPAARSTGNPGVLTLVVSSLNETFDISTKRLAAFRTHQPIILSAMLLVLTLASSLVAGRSMGMSSRRNWFHSAVFVSVIGATLYVIFDLEYPRFGLIRVDEADRLLLELLEGIR